MFLSKVVQVIMGEVLAQVEWSKYHTRHHMDYHMGRFGLMSTRVINPTLQASICSLMEYFTVQCVLKDHSDSTSGATPAYLPLSTPLETSCV
jgi:hypothetical protein